MTASEEELEATLRDLTEVLSQLVEHTIALRRDLSELATELTRRRIEDLEAQRGVRTVPRRD